MKLSKILSQFCALLDILAFIPLEYLNKNLSLLLFGFLTCLFYFIKLVAIILIEDLEMMNEARLHSEYVNTSFQIWWQAEPLKILTIYSFDQNWGPAVQSFHIKNKSCFVFSKSFCS